MKAKALLCFLCFASAFSFAQEATDSTKVLFKRARYSYMQWDFGYSGMNVKGKHLNGFDISLLGAVFNEKWYTSVGFAGWVSHQTQIPNISEVPPKVDSYVSIYFNNEYLFKPNNLVNFSIPLKISYSGASGYDTIPTGQPYITNWNFTGIDYYRFDGSFWTISPGANIFINLFKPLSLGIGANYRFAFGVPKVAGTNADYSSYSVNAFLRFKFDTRAYMKKAMERQKEYLKKTQ